MDSKLVNYMMEGIENYIKSGIEEEPDKFGYTIYANKMIEIFDIDLPDMNEVMFSKILKEFISYIR